MLYGYPIKACDDNWLHNCLDEILTRIHTNAQNKLSIPEWPDILPCKYRDKLLSRTGLKSKLKTYSTILESFSAQDIEEINKALIDQNKIADLLSCTHDCSSIDNLPEKIKEPLKDLFSYAFSLLEDLQIRHKHYKIIYDAGHRICPFCGCEYFDAPNAPREALDHYLSEGRYPFAAANLRNLAPMGNKCNSRYKLAQDILYNEDGTRRRAFDPYKHTSTTISLENSQLVAGATNIQIDWQITFIPNGEEVTTWDNVFKIKERFKRDVLDPNFNDWLMDFYKFCKRTSITVNSDQELFTALENYAGYFEDCGIKDRAFLKAAVFRMLLRYCQQGNIRLISILREVASGVQSLSIQ